MAPLLQQPLSQFGAWLLYGTSTLSLIRPPHPIKSPDVLGWQPCDIDKFPGIAGNGLPSESIAKLTDIVGLSCANLTVPLDWDDHRKGNITIGMTRLRSTGSEKDVLGSLVYNPGGPGGSASIGIFREALGHGYFSNATREHYDLIGPDPRGVGMSTRVRCDPTLFNERVTLFPTTEEEYQSLVSRNKALGESCLEKTGPLLAYIDTTNAAKDLEAIRSALGDDKLNWLGLSYGTQLGGAYLELFPKTVGRMVLDGNLDHSQSESSNLHDESATYEDVLTQFFTWCTTKATAEECPLNDEDVPRLFDELVAGASKKAVPAPGCKDGECREDVNGEEILYATQGFVSQVSAWPDLASALKEAVDGNATALSSPLATSENYRGFASYAIQCVDWSHSSKSLADVMYKEQLGSYLSPHTKGATQTWTIQLSCIGWPVPVRNPEHSIDPGTAAQAPPVLLVNSLHDPQTSYVWAIGMQEQLPSAVLLTRNGSGHTSYGLLGETTAVIDAFLVNGTLPKHNLILES